MSEHTAGWLRMRSFLKQVAVGPTGSKSLSEAEAYEAMTLCLERSASDVQIAVFVVAERLKRETFDENLGFLRALRDASVSVSAPVPTVVSLGDPFDGFDRAPHFAPVVAATVASCGLPAVVLGAHRMPPKYGITHRQVFESLGLCCDIGGGAESVVRAARRIADAGVAYVDVEDFAPKLHALTAIRIEIAKRQALTTLEKLLTPVRGANATSIVSGFVHTGYEVEMTRLCLAMGDAALVVRGREGHIDVHPHRATALNSGAFDPTAFVTSGEPVDAPQPLTAAYVAAAWRAVLSGIASPNATSVALTAAAILRHAGAVDSHDAGFRMATDALMTHRARDRFERFAA